MVIDGKTFYAMVNSAAAALENQQEDINQLNVFPVPDGDTGINMSMTLGNVDSVVSEDDSISDATAKVSGVVLRAARGNSGAILSLFYRGMAKALKDCDEADSADIALAFQKGTEEAYKAVMNPTEGTILTVMRKCAEEAVEVTKTRFKGDVLGFFVYIMQTAQKTLDETPEMLPVLKEANVVDAGGSGFVVMLSGMLAALKNKPILPLKKASKSSAKKSADFKEFNTEDIRFAYCTECIVDKDKAHRGEGKGEKLGDFVRSIGDSVVFVDTEDLIKLHVHTNNPGQVLEQAIRYGSLLTVKIENMKNQHTALSSDGAKEEAAETEEAPKVVSVPAEKKYGFVSVCLGEGIQNTFRDLGADQIISGGQTMNPSTQDILDAVYKTPAEIVFVLPNNKNIFLAAQQAAEMCEDKRVVMLETRSITQGIAAMMNFDESAEVEANLENMQAAMKNVTTISITYAVRNTTVDGMPIRKGQKLGLVDGKIRCVTDHARQCVLDLTEYMEHAAFVTIFYGESVPVEKAEKMLAALREKLGYDEEYVLIPGGQPLYDYIISAEI